MTELGYQRSVDRGQPAIETAVEPSTRPAGTYVASLPALGSITGRWVMHVLDAIGDSGARHSQIASQIPGLSEKVLTETLRRIEANGLVARCVGPGWPSHLLYVRTERAIRLLPALAVLRAWHNGESSP
jgi:DNA-binding HxlR family transcriptional regulator